MTIRDWLTKAARRIDMLDAELIAMTCFAPDGADRSWLATHDQNPIIDPDCLKNADLMIEDRSAGTPLAYVMNLKEFYGRNFRVTPEVLIPRPETESIIDLAKTLPLKKNVHILEIGTGSGCIAITLALEFPQSSVAATDISPEAIDVARENNFDLEGRVRFYESDLLRDVCDFDFIHCDLIVANLPYVDPKWKWLDKKALSFEPSHAIYGTGQGGLSYYRRFFREIKELEITASYIILEADPCQYEMLTNIAKRGGYKLHQTAGFALAFAKA